MLIDVAKNRFNKAVDARRARAEAAHTQQQQELAAKKEQEVIKWNGNQRATAHGPHGTVLDPQTAEAQRQYHAARTAKAAASPQSNANAIPISLNAEDTDAILNVWKQRMGVTWYDTELNNHNLRNCMLLNLYQGNLTGFNMESLDRVFEYLQANGYYEHPSVRVRGAAYDVPKTFATFVPPKPELTEAQKQEQLKEQADYAREEYDQNVKHAQSLSFEELQEQARKGFNYKRAAARDSISHV